MRDIRTCRCREPILTVAQARFIAAHSSRIDFLNLEHLPPEVAQELSVCPTLRFLKLTSLLPASAQALVNNQASILLPAIQTLDQKTAHHLAQNGMYLSLKGLVELEPGVADALATHQGILNLNRLQVLCVSDARALATHRGQIHLSSLPADDPALWEAFADFPHRLNLGGRLRNGRLSPAGRIRARGKP